MSVTLCVRVKVKRLEFIRVRRNIYNSFADCWRIKILNLCLWAIIKTSSFSISLTQYIKKIYVSEIDMVVVYSEAC